MNDAANIFLYKEGKVLIQHRGNGAFLSPGFWGFFGGEIEDGETPRQAVIRECFEELNYQLKDPKFLFKRRFLQAPTFPGWRNYFVEEYDGSELKLDEGQGMRWVSEEDLDGLKMRPYNREVLKEIINKIKNL